MTGGGEPLRRGGAPAAPSYPHGENLSTPSGEFSMVSAGTRRRRGSPRGGGPSPEFWSRVSRGPDRHREVVVPNSQPQPQPHSYEPFELDDFWLFVDANSIRVEHSKRGTVPDSGHGGSRRRDCHECQQLALGGLSKFSARARKRGWTRQQALGELSAHPATYDSMVKEGRRMERAANGRLSKPYNAAFGAHYRRALSEAFGAGELSVAVKEAQRLLGFAIQAVQDETSVKEFGNMLPWTRLEKLLAWSVDDLPVGTCAWHVWDEIVAACSRVPRAAKLLDEHVFSKSAGASRHVAPLVTDADGRDLNLIELADESQSMWAGHGGSGRFEQLVDGVVERLLRRGTCRPEHAAAEACRALQDHGVDPGLHSGLVDSIAALAVEDAGCLLAPEAAADRVVAGGHLDIAVARAALDAVASELGLVVRGAPVATYHDWLDRGAVEVLTRAGRRREWGTR